MCGYVGAFSSKRISESCNKDLKSMINKIKHRGPDALGSFTSDNFITNFARLSIIDLKRRSDQPFIDSSKRFVLVFNGEIYNYLDLKRQLEKYKVKFKTSSDTEVVIESFKKWGTKCLNKFEGMFSFAIFDKKKKLVYLCRDQLGIKPLYYSKFNNILYFASEIKAFKNIFNFKLNKKKIIEYSVFGNIAGDETLIQGIKQVTSGTFLKINYSLSINKHIYFDLKKTFFNSKKNSTNDDIHGALVNSVKSHTVSDVGYATQLSGGLDSSLITAITSINKSKNFKLHTYSVSLNNKDVDERKFQKIVHKKYKTIHHNVVCNPKMICENISKMIWMYDYPLHHPNIIPSYFMNNLASKNKVKVMLSGDGADEIFEGYNWSLLNKKTISKKTIFAGNFVPYKIIKKIFKNVDHSFFERKKLIDGIKSNSVATSILNQKLYLDKWLQRQDRAGMYASVEIRVPFCNVNILNKVNHLNHNIKTNFGKDSKFILKEISNKYLEKKIYNRKKIGFPLPLEDWFRNKNGIKSLIKYIQDETFYSRDIYDHRFIEDLIDLHLRKKQDLGRVLWVVINVELWHRTFID